jgi:hypothetical protein
VADTGPKKLQDISRGYPGISAPNWFADEIAGRSRSHLSGRPLDPQDLPLLEELKIIHHQIRHAIILIDDFRHPEDPGYGFDEYAGGVNIELKLLKRADPAFHQVLFPILDFSRETGMKRGSAYLGLGSGLKLLETCKELKKISAVRGL